MSKTSNLGGLALRIVYGREVFSAHGWLSNFTVKIHVDPANYMLHGRG